MAEYRVVEIHPKDLLVIQKRVLFWWKDVSSPFDGNEESYSGKIREILNDPHHEILVQQCRISYRRKKYG